MELSFIINVLHVYGRMENAEMFNVVLKNIILPISVRSTVIKHNNSVLGTLGKSLKSVQILPFTLVMDVIHQTLSIYHHMKRNGSAMKMESRLLLNK